jgi:HEAT repeat protein
MNMRKIMIFSILIAIGILALSYLSLYAQTDDDEIGELIEKLTEDLDSPYEPVRIKAVRELSKILDRRVANPLIYALKDESKFVRMEACKGLGELKHPRAVEPMGILLLKEEETYVRKECAWALGNMGFVEALPYLYKQLEVEEKLIVRKAIEHAIDLLED